MDVVTAVRTGRAHLEAGAPLEAVRVLEEVAEHLEQDVSGQLLLARAYDGSAQLGRAEQALSRVLALDPVDSWARLLPGRTLERAARPQEALTQFRLAAAMQPHPEFLEQRDRLAARLSA